MFFNQKVLVVTQSEVQHIIQERTKELQELKHNADVLKVRWDIALANVDECKGLYGWYFNKMWDILQKHQHYKTDFTL